MSLGFCGSSLCHNLQMQLTFFSSGKYGEYRCFCWYFLLFVAAKKDDSCPNFCSTRMSFDSVMYGNVDDISCTIVIKSFLFAATFFGRNVVLLYHRGRSFFWDRNYKNIKWRNVMFTEWMGIRTLNLLKFVAKPNLRLIQFSSIS